MNNNRFIRNAIKIILSLVFLAFFQLLFGNISFASTKTKDEIGKYIAEFSVNFQEEHGDEVVYCLDNYADLYDGHRARAYINGEKAHNGYYGIDCVGWVSFAVHYSTGLGSDTQFNYFVTPQNGACWSSDGYVFEQVGGKETQLMPGDIIKSYDGNTWQHVMIYVGNGRIVHCAAGLQNQLFTDSKYYYSPWTVYRINDTGVAAINDAELTTIYNGQGGITGEYSDEYAEDGGFRYQGTAGGAYGSRVYNLEWFINSLAEILDWFVGMCTYIFRVIALGWTAVFEEAINGIMKWTTGEEASLTIEKLVNNKVAVLDVNFFNFSTAGGEEIKEDSIMYVARENIAAWYYILRTVSIIGLLITLVYIAIRMALSTIGEQKAKYKELLVSWLVSFGIVFFIHYIMIIILQINESLIELINIYIGGGEESLYDSVRSSAYALQASVGWPSLIVYIILIYLLLKFLFMYFKRFLVVGILTFMSPIIGVTYSIDKIKDNKSQSLSNWLKEYTFNVLIQSVHALLYALFVNLAMNMIGDSIMGALLSLFMMKFMLDAESLFKKIFGIKSGQMKDALASSLAIMNGAQIVKNMAKTNFKAVALVTKPISKPVKEIASKTKQFRRSDKIDKVKRAIDEARASGESIVSVGRNKFDISELSEDSHDSLKIASKLVAKDEAIKKESKQQAKNLISQGANTALGTVEAVAAIPMSIIEGEEGAAMFVNAKSHLSKGINEVNKNKNYYKGKGDTIKNMLTGGAYKNIKNIHGEVKSYKKKTDNSVYNAQHEIAIKKLQKKVNNEIRRLSKDPNINQAELAKVIEDTNTMVSDEVILNVTYQIEASIGNDVLIKTNKKKGNTESIYTKVEKMSAEVPDINSLHSKVKELTNMKERKVIDIDNKKFEKNVKSELITMIAKENKSRKKDVLQSEVENKFKNMSNEERADLMKKAMFKATTLTDKVQEEKTKDLIKSSKTNMALQNVHEIIEVMKETSKLPINAQGYKENVENLIKKNIAKKENIGIEQIERSDIDSYIAGISNKELVRIIKIAGAEENSLIQNRNANKPEYDKLVNNIKELRNHKVQLKGTK